MHELGSRKEIMQLEAGLEKRKFQIQVVKSRAVQEFGSGQNFGRVSRFEVLFYLTTRLYLSI